MEVGVTDEELMLRYRDGDARAFESLYARHKSALYRYLRGLCRNDSLVDDVFQESWSKLIVHRAAYEVRATFKTYLFHLAHNCAIDALRRANRLDAREVADVDDLAEVLPAAEGARPDAGAAALQLQQAFRQALEELPAEQRDAFLMYEESGMGLTEIGVATGVSMETAKSRLRYAVAKLRRALASHRPDLGRYTLTQAAET